MITNITENQRATLLVDFKEIMEDVSKKTKCDFTTSKKSIADLGEISLEIACNPHISKDSDAITDKHRMIRVLNINSKNGDAFVQSGIDVMKTLVERETTALNYTNQNICNRGVMTANRLCKTAKVEVT